MSEEQQINHAANLLAQLAAKWHWVTATEFAKLVAELGDVRMSADHYEAVAIEAVELVRLGSTPKEAFEEICIWADEIVSGYDKACEELYRENLRVQYERH